MFAALWNDGPTLFSGFRSVTFYPNCLLLTDISTVNITALTS